MYWWHIKWGNLQLTVAFLFLTGKDVICVVDTGRKKERKSSESLHVWSWRMLLTCVDSSCRSPARPTPPHPTWQLRTPMTSRQRVKPRPLQVWTTNRHLNTRLFFPCYGWHLFCVFLTALTRITNCCEEAAQRVRCGYFFLFRGPSVDFKAADERPCGFLSFILKI